MIVGVAAGHRGLPREQGKLRIPDRPRPPDAHRPTQQQRPPTERLRNKAPGAP